MWRIVTDDKQRVGAWVAERVEQTASWGSFYAMGAEDAGGALVAGIVMNNYNGANATAHIAIERTGRYLPALLRTFLRYAFWQCGLKRLTGLVPTDKPRVIAFDRHLGFEEEFVMRHASPGCDMLVLVMWPDKCRWLRG